MANDAVSPMVLALLERARQAAEFAYAPYSRFSVERRLSRLMGRSMSVAILRMHPLV